MKCCCFDYFLNYLFQILNAATKKKSKYSLYLSNNVFVDITQQPLIGKYFIQFINNHGYLRLVLNINNIFTVSIPHKLQKNFFILYMFHTYNLKISKYYFYQFFHNYFIEYCNLTSNLNSNLNKFKFKYKKTHQTKYNHGDNKNPDIKIISYSEKDKKIYAYQKKYYLYELGIFKDMKNNRRLKISCHFI